MKMGGAMVMLFPISSFLRFLVSHFLISHFLIPGFITTRVSEIRSSVRMRVQASRWIKGQLAVGRYGG